MRRRAPSASTSKPSWATRLLRGYDDADPSSNTAIYSGDYLAGAQGAFAVMTALWHRDRTGEGQLIEIAQAENAACMFTQAIMDYSLNGNVQGAIGNRDVHGRAPFGVYPAESPGTAETMRRPLDRHPHRNGRAVAGVRGGDRQSRLGERGPVRDERWARRATTRNSMP